MATTAEYAPGFSRSSSMSAARSPDTASPIYPERAIRPLPKSRLKSKLSPEQASSIVYPPDPPPISPTLNFSVQEPEGHGQQPRLTNGHAHHLHHQERQSVHNHCTCGEDGDSGDDEVEFDHPDFRYSGEPAINGSTKPVDSVQRRLIEAARNSNKPPPPGSTASSADGYESFENTSNKKKRKIPLSGASGMHQSQLSAEMASMGIGGNQGDAIGDETSVNGHNGGQSNHSPQSSMATGTGISGAGRGRYGRQDARVRRPLGSSTMNAINGYHSRVPSRDLKNGSAADTSVEDATGGIISQAIRTAAEQGPLTPPGKGRENISLLQSAATASATTTPKTQFTFTCESDSANKLVDQSAAAYLSGTPTPARSALPGNRGTNTQGTQTAPTPRNGQSNNNNGTSSNSNSNSSAHNNNNNNTNVSRPPPPPSSMATSTGGSQQPAGPSAKPKTRRNPTKEYALQALSRKKQQQYQNYHHRPKPEDMWICGFCEYEEIFGEPAYAMIRRYEIKDRQERKKAAERRRLLEKAKMKGRKNKKGASGKGNKNNANSSSSTAPSGQSQNYDPNLPPPDGEEYYDDDEEYGDEYEPVGPEDHYSHEYYPPPAPAGTPATAVAGAGTHGHG